MWRLYLIVIVFANQCLMIYSIENWPSSGMKDTHFERVMEGQDITLKCAGRVEGAPAYWDFKACGSGFNRSLCVDVINEENTSWHPLTFNISTFKLTNVKYTEGGLYRCRQAATPLIYIYYTIHLEIITYHDVLDEDLPKFLDGLPKNITVHTNSQAVFQCKVSSKTQAKIMWVWQGAAPGALRHLGEWYAPVGDGEVGQADGVGIAKLVLPRAKPNHTGRYFCVAVNIKGFTNSSAYLQVISDEGDGWHETNYLYVLFLLPVGLAIVPISLWLCFLWIRRKRYLSNVDEQKPNVELPLKYPECDEESCTYVN